MLRTLAGTYQRHFSGYFTDTGNIKCGCPPESTVPKWKSNKYPKQKSHGSASINLQNPDLNCPYLFFGAISPHSIMVPSKRINNVKEGIRRGERERRRVRNYCWSKQFSKLVPGWLYLILPDQIYLDHLGFKL